MIGPWIARLIAKLRGKRLRYFCRCGWAGNVCSWTDTSDAGRTHLPICPRCFSGLK
jgi:hypothetical protein